MIHQIALKVFGALPRFAKDRTIRLLYPTFTTGTSVCITNSQGQVLLVTHSYSAGWGLPGGLVGRHESPIDTAARELVEELDVHIVFTDPPIPFQSPGRRHWNMLFKAVLDPIPDTPICSHSAEISDVEWFSLDTLPELADFTSEMLVLLGALDGAETEEH